MQYDPKKLQKFFHDNEIEVILFDLDDTLIDTNLVFVKKVHAVLDHLSSSLSIDPEKLSKRFKAELIKAHGKVAVNPEKLWPTILQKCGKIFGWEESVTKEAYKSLLKIYTTLPKVLPGTVSTLKALKEAERNLGIVTHASREWTDFKLEGLDLGKFFDHVELFNTNIHKSVSAWENAIKAFKVEPSNALVVGDSVTGDIQAAHKVGVRNLVWVNRDEAWSHYKKGKLPNGTIEIRGMDEFLTKLCKSV